MTKKIKLSLVAARAMYPDMKVKLNNTQKHDNYSLQKLRRGRLNS